MKSTCYTWSLCCKRSGWHGTVAAAYGSGRFCAAAAATSAMIKAWTSLVVNTFVSTDVGGEDKSQVKTPTRKPEQEQLAHMGTRHRATAVVRSSGYRLLDTALHMCGTSYSGSQ